MVADAKTKPTTEPLVTLEQHGDRMVATFSLDYFTKDEVVEAVGQAMRTATERIRETVDCDE